MHLIGGKFGDRLDCDTPDPGLAAGCRELRSLCLGVEERRDCARPGPVFVLRLPDPVLMGT